MILVTGASGSVGGATLKQLTARGVAVRALIRNHEKARSLSALGVETVIADFDQPDSLDAALQGVSSALLVSPLDPRKVSLQSNFIAAAKRAGDIHIVKLSGLGTALDSALQSGRWHAEIERRLEDSGLLFTFLRPPYFMQNIARSLVFHPDGGGEIVAPMRDAKIAMIDVHDIAGVAAAALSGQNHSGKAYTITGPQALSFTDVAGQLSGVLGKQIVYRDVSLQAMRQRLLEKGMPAWHVDIVIEFWTVLREGFAETVTRTVETVTGRPARAFERFARAHEFMP